MNVYFDTEFSGVEKKNGHRYLISIGCVAQDGREFYAESMDTWDESQCSIFTIEHVLPLLQGGDVEMKVGELAVRLAAWIEGLTDAQVTFYSDAPTFDWPFLQEIFDAHRWPNNLRRNCGAIGFEHEAQQTIFNAALEDYWGVAVHARLWHHSLYDAKSLAYAWWHSQANVMLDSEFKSLMSTLSRWSVEDGDHGYIYWSGVMSNLKKLRTLPRPEK